MTATQIDLQTEEATNTATQIDLQTEEATNTATVCDEVVFEIEEIDVTPVKAIGTMRC